jgi:hypothetical protein
MSDRPKVVVPIVHLNGTSAKSLKDALDKTYDALTAVMDALREGGPNGRDYYLEPGKLDKAIAQQRRRMETVKALQDEIEAEMVGIDEQCP